jgi:hypothetical protein
MHIHSEWERKTHIFPELDMINWCPVARLLIPLLEIGNNSSINGNSRPSVVIDFISSTGRSDTNCCLNEVNDRLP